MSISFTQDEWKVRSLDVVHINPSILEGQFAHTSTYGKRSALLLQRYEPTNLVAPSISGDYKIPSVLTCNPGVWDAAPTADYLYQWRADGVEIPGETGQTWTSDISFDAQSIDCVVTAVNVIGFDTLTSSNQIEVEIVEPIEIMEQDYYSITGLNQIQHQNMNIFRSAVVTGIAVPAWQTNFELITGIVSGMNVSNTLTNFDVMTYAIQGLGTENTQTITESDAYIIGIKEFVETGSLVNGNAEDGLNGWTQTDTDHLVVASSSEVTGIDGDNVFWGGANASAGMTQEIPVPVSMESIIDDGLGFAVLLFAIRSNNGNDAMTPSMFFKNSSGNVIGSNVGNQYIGAGGWWTERTLNEGGDVTMPVGTRFIELSLDFTRYDGVNLNAYIDQIVIEFWRHIGEGAA